MHIGSENWRKFNFSVAIDRDTAMSVASMSCSFQIQLGPMIYLHSKLYVNIVEEDVNE